MNISIEIHQHFTMHVSFFNLGKLVNYVLRLNSLTKRSNGNADLMTESVLHYIVVSCDVFSLP